MLASWSCASPGQVALAAACINPPDKHLFSSGPSVSFPFILLLAPFCSLRTSALLEASRYQGWAPVSIRSAQAAPVSSAPAALVPSAGCEQTRDCSVPVVLVQEVSLSSGADSLPLQCTSRPELFSLSHFLEFERETVRGWIADSPGVELQIVRA